MPPDWTTKRQVPLGLPIDMNTTSPFDVLPRCVDIRASLPAQRALTTYGPQASHTGAPLRGPLGPAGMKNFRRFSFFFGTGGSKTIFVKVPRISPNMVSTDIRISALGRRVSPNELTRD